MADTPNSKPITAEWIELYNYFGIAPGTQVLVNCRGNHSVYLAESATIPTDDHDGIELYPTRQLIVDIESTGVWCRTSKGKHSAVIVQEDLIHGN